MPVVCPAGHDSESTDFCDVCGMRIGGAPGTGSVPGSAPSASQPAGPAAGAGAAEPEPPGEPCPQCGTARAARTAKFCEVCGFDFTAGKPAPAPAPASVAPATGGLATASLPGAGTGTAGPGPTPDPPPAAPATASTPATGPASTPATGPASTPVAGPAWSAVVAADRTYYDSVVAAGGPDAATIEYPGYCPERRFRLSGQEMRIGRRSVSRGLEPEIDLTGPPTDPGISHLHAVLLAGADGGWAVLDPGSANGTQVNGTEIATGVQVPLHDGDRICIGAWTVLTIQAT